MAEVAELLGGAYPYLKALHIIGVISWFAGLFYIVRLLIYLTETLDRPAPERDVLFPQLQLMASRLWFGITWPACIVTCVFGLLMVPIFWPAFWLQLKLLTVAGLLGYHLVCHWLHARLQRGERVWSSTALRVWNEVATLFMVAIVFLVVVKNGLSLVYGTVGLIVFAAVLMLAITIYRRVRTSAAG